MSTKWVSGRVAEAVSTRSAHVVKAALITTLAFAVMASTAVGAAAKTLYVSKKGKDAGACSQTHPCKTINFAVGKATRGATVIVEPGIYHQDVAIKKDIRVIGVGKPVVSAAGLANGFLVSGAGATVSGFTVDHASLEGILVEKTSHVTISNNIVLDNDLGRKAAKPTGECAASGQVPGDCGEGLHLMSVTHSLITSNTVKDNEGGILLTDEAGPTAHNTVSDNKVTGNVLDCGITLAGHNPKATAGGKPQPKVAGIYSNDIVDNTANDNGTKGEGGGILMAGGAPGAAVYDNLIEGNTANGNGLAGVTIHSHSFGPGIPPADLNGNKIIDNKLSHDGVKDSPSEAEFSTAAFGKNTTVGILVGSDVVKLSGIVITGNTISNTHFGIWTKNAPKVSPKANKFKHVTVHLKQI